MTVLAPIKAGWQTAWKYRKLIGLLYLLILILAVLIIMPLNSWLSSNAGHSMMLADLVNGFDYTFLNDFKNAYGAGLAPILQNSIMIILLFYLCFLFLTAGSLNVIQTYPDNYSSVTFWSGGSRFFWPMLRLFIYFLIVHLILLALFGWLYVRINKGLSPAQLEDDRMILGTLRWLAPIYLLLALMLFCWQDLVRIFIIRQNRRWVYQPVWQAFHHLRRHFLSTYIPYLFFWLILVLLIWLQTVVDQWLNGTSADAIWFSFLVVQVFLFLRLSIRVAIWGMVSVGSRQ